MCKKLCFLMSVVLVLGLVGSVSAVVNPGRGAFIILITDNAEGDLADLEPFLKGIYGQGVSIEAVNEKYRELDGEKIATLKSASLIIVSDNSDADEYCTIIPDDEPTGLNLALNQPVDSNSNEVVDQVELVPENAVDGDTGTRWSSEANDPQWIYVDLGAEVLVNVVRLNWEAAYAKSYQIQVCNDACSWADVYSTTSGTGGIEQIYFTDVTARYVRVYGTERGHTGEALHGYSLWEFGVYGSGPPPGATSKGRFEELDFWNDLEIPILVTANEHGSSYNNPNYNWRWFEAMGENDWAMEEDGGYAYVNDVCDPIWDGVPIEYGDPCRVWIFYSGWTASPPEIPECNSAGYGTLLATAEGGGSEPNMVLARWTPGTQYWDDPNNPQTPGAPRAFFAMESFSDMFEHFSPDGEKVLENMITDLLQYTFDPNIAYGPYPKPGEGKAPVDVVFHWSPGENVGTGPAMGDGHMLYFSTVWADVNERKTSVMQTPYFMDVNTWDPFGTGYLAYGQTYYWCVDEFNSGHPDGQYPGTLWRSPVWSFKAALSITGEDFENYASSDELRDYWANTTYTTLTLETGEGAIVHGGDNAMKMRAEWEVGEATLTATPTAEWAETNKAMGVWFYGDAANVLTAAELFVTIEDGTATSHKVNYDGSMSDLTDPNWHRWAIDLADFRDAGVDLMDVKKLILGCGTASGDNTVYFDDIELFEWMCLEGTEPVGDFSGPGDINDCVVDLWDAAAFMEVWLEHDYVIYAEALTEDPCAHWDFEEGPGYSTVADISGNGNTGRFLVDCNYPDGYDPDPSNTPEWVAGKVGTWALHFDGNDFVRIEGVAAPTIEAPNDHFTMCIWLNYDEYDEDDEDATAPSGPVFYKGGDKDSTWPLKYDQSPWDATERRYSMWFSAGGTEDDSDLSIQLDDDGGGATGGKTRIHGYRQMDPNVWYHVAIQRDWDTHKLQVYLNAERIASENDESYSATISSVGEPLFIGMCPSNDLPRWDCARFTGGKLDDMRIYKCLLSEGQLLTVMGLAEKPVPIYHTKFNKVDDWIINLEDAAIMAENWGVNTRFPDFP